MAKFCGYCGTTLTDGVKFCTECGKAQTAPQQKSNQQQQHIQQPVEQQQPQSAAYAPPIQQAAQPPPVYQRQEKPKRKGGWLLPYRIISSVLAVALIITGTIGVATRGGGSIPGWLSGDNNTGGGNISGGNNINNGGGENDTDEAGIRDYVNDLAEIPAEDLDYPEASAPIAPEGNSKAFRITPVAGLTISAEQNALDRDRNWDVREVNDTEWEKYVAPLYETEVMIFSAHKVDAGLAPDEMFPGKFKMEFDIETLDVPDFMLDNLAVLRIDDDGNFYFLQSEVSGGRLVCESRQNSILITLGIGCQVMALGLALIEWYGDSQKFGETKYAGLVKNEGTISMELPRDEWVPAPTASVKKKPYVLTWSAAGHAEFQKQKKIVMEAYAAAGKETKEYFDNKPTSSYTIDQKNSYYNTLLKSYFSQSYYGDALKKINDEDWVLKNCTPPEVLVAIEAIEAADRYIRTVAIPNEAYLPTGIIDIVMLPKLDKDTLGLQVKPQIGPPYIQLSAEEIKKSRGNAFVTVAHEMLHVFQYYIIGESKSHLQFCEAAAVYFERQVANDYLTAGYIDAIPKLTQNDYWQYFVRGNEWSKDVSIENLEKDILAEEIQHYGYTLSNFLFYLKDVKGIDLKVQDLLEGYKKTGTHREAIIYASKGKLNDSLSPDMSYNMQWTAYSRYKVPDCYTNYLTAAATIYEKYGLKEITLDKTNQKITVDYGKVPFSGSFLQKFKTTEKEFSYLVVKPAGHVLNPVYASGLKSNPGQAGAEGAGKMASAGSKIWIEGNNDPDFETKRDSVWVQFTLFWAHQYKGNAQTDVYILPKPDKPAVTAGEKGDTFTVTYPQWSQAYRDGHMSGIIIDCIVETGKGNAGLEPFVYPKGNVDASDLFYRKTFTQSGTETLISVRVAEYLDTAYGRVQGPYSDFVPVILPQLEEMENQKTTAPATTKPPEIPTTTEEWNEDIKPEITTAPSAAKNNVIDLEYFPGFETANGIVDFYEFTEHSIANGRNSLTIGIINVTEQETRNYYDLIKTDRRYARLTQAFEDGAIDVYNEMKLYESDSKLTNGVVGFNYNVPIDTKYYS
ncbi:MAG: zinc ribbon domain-containing protein, partial [Defluviitaleaceae bacterium]|nr:zinc ribbon domain-containing protein [Defluviitaleaceae bacterium]